MPNPVSPLGKLCKCQLIELDPPRAVTLTAMYNPNQIRRNKQIPWTPSRERGEESTLQFTGARGAKLDLELFFDTYEQKTNVHTEYISKLHQLTDVREHADSKQRRPPLCLLTWGTGFPQFKGVIESVNVKYTMFLHDGTPVRATATVKLTRARSADRQVKNRVASPADKTQAVPSNRDICTLTPVERKIAGIENRAPRTANTIGTTFTQQTTRSVTERQATTIQQQQHQAVQLLSAQLAHTAVASPTEYAQLVRDRRAMTAWMRHNVRRLPAATEASVPTAPGEAQRFHTQVFTETNKWLHRNGYADLPYKTS